MQKQINFDLSNVANGGLQEKLDRALNQVTENIMDPNTDQTKKRKITINLVFEPSKSGDASPFAAGHGSNRLNIFERRK